MFDCQELECGKEWDGHTEEDVTRLLSLEQQPCEDAISREEAIRVAEQGQIQGYEWQFKKLCNLPSVTSQQKIGKWLAKSFHEVYCDNCGFDFDIMTNEFIDKMKYCPNCGAKMESEVAK
jgi:NADH pyrophosphatase NudC (nudix superfamily)